MKRRLRNRLRMIYYPWKWRLTHPRCFLFGHDWGELQEWYEIGHLYEAGVWCERCGIFCHTFHHIGGENEFGRRLRSRRDRT